MARLLILGATNPISDTPLMRSYPQQDPLGCLRTFPQVVLLLREERVDAGGHATSSNILKLNGSNAEGSNPGTPGQPRSTPWRVLDVGCGNNKLPGAIGIDRVALPAVDVVHDLNSFPYPFDSSSFDEIRLIHVIEHLDSIIRVMEEIYRMVRPGGRVTIITPHYSDFQSWNDPTHRWHLTTYSFRYFEPEWESSYYSLARFKIESIHIDMARIWRPLGVEALLNLSLRHNSLRSVRKFWEGYLSFLLRAGAMTFILSPLK